MAETYTYGEWTQDGTDTDIPEGAHLFSYSASFGNQGNVSVLCNGSTSGNQHYVTGNVVGNAKIVLTDKTTSEDHTLVDGNSSTAGVTLSDATHLYHVKMNSNGGYAKVTCPNCGSVNYIYGSVSMLFRASGTHEPKIKTQPSNQTVRNGEAEFTVDSIETSSYQWQISSDGESFSNLSNGIRADNAVVSGATTNTLNLSNLGTSYKNYYFRCKLTSSYGYEAYTNSVVLHFIELFTIDIDGVEKKITDVYFGVRGKARKITWKGGGL